MSLKAAEITLNLNLGVSDGVWWLGLAFVISFFLWVVD